MTKNELVLVQGGMILFPIRTIFSKTVSFIYKAIKLIVK